MIERGKPRRVIFTDTGLDDAAGLFYLKKLHEPGLTEVASSFGNVPEPQALENIQTLRNVFNFPRNWKIIRGPSNPVEWAYAPYSRMAVYKGNGSDGLWGVRQPHPIRRPIYYEHMDFTDVGTIKEIISLAPLTGPYLLHRNGANPAKTLIMGGAFLEGNVRPIGKDGNYAEGFPRVAEWNFFKDVNAARDYFEKYAGLNVWVVTKDACMAALVSAETILGKKRKPGIDYRFMKKIMESWAKEYAKINPAVVQRGLMLSDLVAVISYKHPEIADWEETGFEIVDKVGPDLGRSLRSKSNPKCKVATRIKEEQLDNLFETINETVFGTP